MTETTPNIYTSGILPNGKGLLDFSCDVVKSAINESTEIKEIMDNFRSYGSPGGLEGCLIVLSAFLFSRIEKQEEMLDELLTGVIEAQHKRGEL